MSAGILLCISVILLSIGSILNQERVRRLERRLAALEEAGRNRAALNDRRVPRYSEWTGG